MKRRLVFFFSLATLAIVPTVARAQSIPYSDELAQAPELKPPSRGSVAGQYASVAFGPGDLGRGTFSLPLPITLPTERGAIGASPLPTYSPDGALSEWGAGWSAPNLSIVRSRIIGEIDYATNEAVAPGDERTGPWGRMLLGTDGAWYPDGLKSAVRVVESGSNLVAYLPDGSVWTFSGVQGIVTPAGVYSWGLQSVVTALGRTTTYSYTHNASGHPFVSAITYGGTDPTTPQYQLVFDYTTLSVPVADYRSGQAVLLDRRIATVHTQALDGGQLTERHTWSLGYQQDPTSPTFYLATLTQTFAASGQTAPTVTYTTDLAKSYFSTASAQPVPQFDWLLTTYGLGTPLPNMSAQVDIDLDGRTDLETQYDNTLLQQTDAGYVAVPLEAATSAPNALCRKIPSVSNPPRALARMVSGSDTVHVVALEPSGTSTELVVCDRPGNTLYTTTLPSNFTLGPNTRLVDLNRDHAPDLIRVYTGGYQAIENLSTATGFALGKAVSGPLLVNGSSSVAVNTTWVHDLNGDGIPDLLSRYSGGIVAWMGKGHLEFDPAGKVLPIYTLSGALTGLTSYQFVFFDANNDGITDLLLTNGSTVLLFANSGTSFNEVAVPAFVSSTWNGLKPVVLDASGNGNTELTYVQNGGTYAIDLDAPGVGLMSSADDGRGTVLRFSYQRAPADVGVRYRNSLIQQLQVVSTGYDPLTYEYAFQTPDLHSVGLFLLGYEQVQRQGVLDLSAMTFSNTDDAPGMMLSSTDQDVLEPSVEKVAYRTYATSAVNGVPWRQVLSEGKGWSSTNAQAPMSMLEETQYAAYSNSVCPSQIIKTSSAGTLTTTKTFYSSLFPNALPCIDQDVTMAGTHADSTLNFEHQAAIARNSVGQVTNLTMFDPTTGNPFDVQDVTYTPDWNVQTISAPGRGASTYVFAPATGLISSIAEPNGVLTAVTNRDPVTDAILELTLNRGGLLYQRDFTFDGQERLSTSWNNLGSATAAVPNETDTYRYASGASPALTMVTSLASLSWQSGATGASQPSATYAQTAYVAAADGESLALARLIPQGWTFGHVTQRSRATRSVNQFVSPTVADVTALDVPSLYAGAQQVTTDQASLFGFAAVLNMTFQAGVAKDVTGALGIDGAGLERVDVENGALSTASTLDEQSHVTNYLDEAATSTGYVYDAYGRVRRVVLPDGTHHAVDYDNYARVSIVARDGVATIQFAYDPTTGLIAERDVVAPAGTPTAGSIWQRAEYQYDAVGRASLETDVDSTTGASQTFQFMYDGATPTTPAATNALGLLTAVVGDGYTRTMAYRADGVELTRVVAIDGWRTIENDTLFDEDNTARQDTVTVSDGDGNVLATDVSTSTRDAYGRVAGEQRDGSPFVVYAYDPNGLPLTATFAGPYSNGEVVTLAYDPTTRMRMGLSQSNNDWSSGVTRYMNTRGLADSEDILVSSLSTTRSFGYSPQAFLAQSSDPTATYSYTYAPDGQPAQIVSSVGGISDVRAFSWSGNVLTAGAHQQTFDDIGRVIQRDGVTLSYGGNGQVAGAQSATSEWSYLYDELGNRVAKLVGGVPIAAYLPDGSYLDAASLTMPLRFANQFVAVLRASTGASPATKEISLLATDLTGTILSDQDGTPRLASPFGDRAAHPDLAAAIDYAAKGYDADLGTVRMGVRDYDPAVSRFLTPDPLYLANPAKCVGKPTECNLYSYARNAPLDFIDGTGMDTVVLHGGGPGSASGVAVLAETSRALFAPGTPVVIPNDVHASKPGEGAALKRDPSFAVAYASSYEHSYGSQKNLVGFSLGGDAAIMSAAMGPPMEKGACALRYDNLVVVGARVDNIMENIEGAAKNSAHVVIVNLVNDKYAWPLGSDAVFGDRRYESLVGSIEAKYGSMAAFQKAFPNVSIQSAVGSHGGGGNREATQTAVVEGYRDVVLRDPQP
jgi:RHS repeat-associated protein